MIFPVDEAVIPTEIESTNVGRSFAFDYKTKRFQMQDGAPVETLGIAAVKQWVELFTRTLPGKYAVHPDDLGTSCDLLIGGRYPASFATYDITRAVALAVVELGGDLDTAWAGVDVDNIKGVDLTKWCWQRKGVARKEAVKATGQITVTAGSGTVSVGDLFESVGGIQFVSTGTETVSPGSTVNIEAVIGGAAGNIVIGSITGMPVTLPGIATVTSATATAGGFNAESDTALRERYYDALRKPMTSGNKNQYEVWAKEVPGVGDAKIYPLERGANTVEIVIADADMTAADTSLVAAAQTYIDLASAGTGEGVAPIGAHCYVETATEVVINVEVTVVILPGYSIGSIEDAMEPMLREYFKSIAFVQDY